MSLNPPRETAFSCGLPAALVDPTWFVRQNSNRLFALVREQLDQADVENSALADLGHALGQLQQGHEEAADGVGVLLTSYSAVAEMHNYLVHHAMAELQKRHGQ